jgi:2-furoate---CoA ligase
MNLGHYFEAVVHRAPGAIAIVDNQVRWTYADLARETESVASGLWSVGLRPRDRVMVLPGNRRENVVIFWACQKLGLVYVPVNYHFSPNDIAYCIEDAEPEVLFFDDASAATIHALAGRGRLPKKVYFVGENDQPPFKSYAALHRTGAVPSLHIVAGDDAIAVMLYSSGATGKPKGVPRSHTNELSATTAHIIHNSYGFYESTVAISSFCHTMGLRMLLAMALLNGKLVLPSDDAPETYLALIEQERISSLYAFPSVYHDLLNADRAYSLNSVRKVAYAGAPMSKDTLEQCLAGFTADTFVNHFGSTEIYTYTTCSWLARKHLCAGKAGINTQLRLVVPMNTATVLPDQVVAAGEVGELIVRITSPEAFKGYWNRPDLTARTIRDGWFFTGDLVRIDAEGDLWVLGRVDDMVILGGEKVYPSEVETVLRAHPKIKEAVVLGIPDKRAGQLLTAFVVPADASLTVQELEQFCKASYDLADFKRPARFILLESIPRRNDKLLRGELARMC